MIALLIITVILLAIQTVLLVVVINLIKIHRKVFMELAQYDKVIGQVMVRWKAKAKALDSDYWSKWKQD